jgi:mannose-6-phosphate isomerase
MAFFQSGDKEIVVDDDTVEPYESPLAHQKSYDDFSAVQEPKARQGRVYRLQPAVKQYAWGIRGGDSRVARYGLETGALKVIDQSAPYAEIWLGTHPSGPSLLDDGTELSKVVKGGNLPWLLKVLSAGKALSIQAHPDKSLAEKLHKDKPDLYKDSNHKPEMAIALTPFEAMCGFRRLSEIAVHLRKHPEFAACISTEAQLAVFTAGPRDSKAQKLALHKVFESFMACEPDVSSAQLKLLVQRLRREQRAQFRPSGAQHINPAAPVLSPGSAAKDDDVPESAWERKAARAILRLEEQFPGDVGAMAPLFLNYLLIAPGESFFMAANEPHAYVAGEILECMACSDNVVRAGLTPKMKDVDNLVDMLTYSMGGPDIEFGRLVHQGPGTRTLCYTPPVPEFEVLITTVETGATYDIAPCEVPSILICVEGIGHTQSAPGPDGVEPQRKHRYELCPGKSLYITAGTVALTLVNDMTTKGPLRVARARQNLSLAGRAEDSQ